MPSLRVLRTFLAVAAEGSFTAAAHRVALTASAVGLQMRTLEADLRRTLFTRHGKVVALNEHGRALLPVAAQMVALYDGVLHGAMADAPMAGTVRFGAVVSALARLVQATLALKGRHAALDLHVSSGKSDRLIAQVEAGEIDAAVVVQDPALRRPSLAWTPLYTEPMVLLAPAAWPATGARAAVERHPFIRFARDEHTGQLVERTLRRLRARPQEFLELNSIEAIVDLVRSGLGVTVLPQLGDGTAWATDRRLRMAPIAQATEPRTLALVQLRTTPRSAVIAAVGQRLLHGADTAGRSGAASGAAPRIAGSPASG
ncbi:LysR family transcriptional regulator [uncultured Xylophilus sp.]|uniref:LysR family transcriptional regulator n=1 Tax=uncultured Xylophilus sp. TaxID=296832 RepID=UPI0025D8C33B|nr:LysR family transcriptional regulator [uncultured Xylophilus sp.]